MKVSEARAIVARAVAAGRISRDEAIRRQAAITRLARKPWLLTIWVEDLESAK